MNRSCPHCLGIGWVCENHPNRPWDDAFGCTCGAGIPCKCNETDDLDETDVALVVEFIEQTPTKH
jgi:hypothetical protein